MGLFLGKAGEKRKIIICFIEGGRKEGGVLGHIPVTYANTGRSGHREKKCKKEDLW